MEWSRGGWGFGGEVGSERREARGEMRLVGGGAWVVGMRGWVERGEILCVSKGYWIISWKKLFVYPLMNSDVVFFFFLHHRLLFA